MKITNKILNLQQFIHFRNDSTDFSRIIRVILFTLLLIIVTSNNLFAAAILNTDSTEHLVLRKIMSDMGKNMQIITDGISRENWKQVKKTALRIADHPQPPFTEKLRILSFVGSDVSKYKEHDQITHDLAIKLSRAAIEKDAYKVISVFTSLQNACLACHQSFRKSFLEYFYQ